jgi:hypothetical protein
MDNLYQFTVPPAGDYNYWFRPVVTGYCCYPAGICIPSGCF